jgi:hypothetical protein
MKKKFLVSVLLSIGILVVGVGAVYAAFAFKANQEGYRQAGETQATRLTMRVEAGVADPNGDFVPDDPSTGNRGGDLTFSIKNTNNVPLRVTKIEIPTSGCALQSSTCITSNKNKNGSFALVGGWGDCNQYLTFAAPFDYGNWPVIPPHGTLQVNGTDNSRLGAGLVHLLSTTPDGCQGASFAMQLKVTAVEYTYPSDTAPLP